MEEYQRLYRRSLDDPECVLGASRRRRSTGSTRGTTVFDADYEEVDFAWYSGGRLNACYNCVDRHLADARRTTAIIWAADEPGVYRHISLPRAQAQRLPARERAARARRQEGRPRLHLHADDPRDGLRDARLRAHRRGALGGVRRLLAPSRCATASWTRGCKVLITANEGAARRQRDPAQGDRRPRGRGHVDMVETVLVARRTEHDVPMQPGRDLWLDEEMRSQRSTCTVGGWAPRTRCSSSTPRAAPGSPRACCTRPAATWSTPRSRTSSCSTTTPATSTAAPPTWAGSPGTATSSTARSRTARPR